MAELDAAEVRTELGLDGEVHRAWTERLAAVPAPRPVDIPRGGAELEELLARLAVPEEDRPELARLRDEVDAEGSAYRWLLERSAARLAASVGGTDWDGELPDLPLELGPAGRYFHAFVFLAGVPAVRARHRALGVPDGVGWDSLADLGNKLGVYRRTFGTGGLDKQGWMTLPFRGVLYRLGRLQFNLTAPGSAAGLAVHIPEGGSMAPVACEESFTRAGEFFRRHFPDRYPSGGGEPIRVSCHSWLLDPQLAEYLPAESNIIRFQRRFSRPADEPWRTGEAEDGGLTPGDRAIVEFVFRRMVTRREEVDALPTRSRLERAILAHLADGRHWHGGHGYATV